MIPTSVRIFVCTQPVDMRRSFDGLAAAAKQVIGEDPRSGALFVFTNRRSNRLKVLWWDKNGYCLSGKRLHQALFRLPSANDPSDRKMLADRLWPYSGNSGLLRKRRSTAPSQTI
ncbi:IS66 family insertion sequence element accessory protein TnpB [Nannocystis bainbridge]|uniref:IS66 family insertion sequence element accessory protein TnpB n=1 Tax=Nannocystis bainbridge TaxID=2995303 RepID=A0ABT5ED26_9BACT|nr:IS66 family insertion sequence element accessory protein TnpB [Nannocystis bainbridge]MDC0723465.1 IS66 family insertion sequence element accessory protein TnpB [Nannocystis bainbridge]